MRWRWVNGDFSLSDDGYRIAIAQTTNGRRYCAFAPEIPYDRFKLTLREAYPQGVSMPQQREPLGCFSTEEQARRACQEHRRPSTANPISPGM